MVEAADGEREGAPVAPGVLRVAHLVDGDATPNSPKTLFKANVRKTLGGWRPAAEVVYVSDRRDRVDGKVGGYLYDYCKGCGLCAKICPVKPEKAITMIKESDALKVKE